jgi:magnesium transporter
MAEGMQFRAAVFDRHCRLLTEEEALAAYKAEEEVIWIDIIAEPPSHAAETFLRDNFDFHPLLIEDALSPHERPTLTVDEDLVFFVAPAIDHAQEAEAYTEVALFVTRKAVVSVATGPCPSLDTWFRSCEKRAHTAHKHAIDIVHSIVDAIVDDYYPVIDLLNDEIDDLEANIYAGKKVDVGDALALKRRLLEMRRRIGPLRDILNGLLRRDLEIIPESSFVYFQDVYDHTLRIIEVIDMERDILSAVMDAHLSMQSNQLNRVMQNMTIIATLLMTAAFIAGVYGMNFDRLPELHWRYGYAFAWALMLGLCGLEVWIFKKKGWM